MSTLDKPTPPETLTESQQKARQVELSIHTYAAGSVRQVTRGLDNIWAAQFPADVLAALGTGAAKVFDLNNQTIAFLVGALSGTDYQPELDAIQARLDAIPAYTTHADGSITIDEVEEEVED